jgi:hypothetical protein
MFIPGSQPPRANFPDSDFQRFPTRLYLLQCALPHSYSTTPTGLTGRIDIEASTIAREPVKLRLEEKEFSFGFSPVSRRVIALEPHLVSNIRSRLETGSLCFLRPIICIVTLETVCFFNNFQKRFAFDRSSPSLHHVLHPRP